MSRPRARSLHGDDGSVLVVALIFLGVMSLVIFVILGETEANLRTTTIVRSRSDRMYAADAALEWAIARLKLDPTLCPAAGGATTTLQNVPTFNNRSVTVKCTPVFGTDLGDAGYALIAKGTLTRQSGGDPTITGPVFATGTITLLGNGGQIKVNNGNVVDSFSNCTGKTAPAGLVVNPSPPFGWSCTTASAPDPGYIAPPAPTAAAPPPVPVGQCTVFSPGKYTAAPALGSDNYFVSGVYYFENVAFNVPNNTTIIGGGGGGAYQLPGLPGNCAGASDASGAGANGSGVEFVFGGTSSFQVNNNTGVEIFSRTPGAGEPTTSPTISFYAVPTTGNGYLAEAPGTIVLNVTTGGAGFISHGKVYAPTADVNLFASNGTIAQLQNGVIGRNISLQASNVGGGLAINVLAGTNRRGVLLTATAASAGESDFAADARIDIRDEVPNSFPNMVVQSWRTCSKAADATLPSPACP